MKKTQKPKSIQTRRPNVTSHTYNKRNKTLTVTFHNGRRYRYSGVDLDKAEAFKASDSKGAFLHAHIIGRHDATQLSSQHGTIQLSD